MKKSLTILLILILSLLSACGQNAAVPAADAASDAANTTDTVTIMVNINGLGGSVELSDDGSDPKPDPEYPMQSAYANVEKGTIVKILAEPEEGYHFYKWTVNGADYATDPLITVTAEEDVEYIAEFLPEGKDGKPVDLGTVTTLGDLLGLPDIGYGLTGTTYVYAFEQDGNIYRAICDVPEETAQAIFDLDFDDPDYDKKENELIGPLPVKVIENLTERMPTQEEAEQYIGKTGQELMDDGWTVHYYNLADMTFRMAHGIYAYDITFEGAVKDPENFNEDADMGGLTVKAITCAGIGDATYIEAPEE